MIEGVSLCRVTMFCKHMIIKKVSDVLFIHWHNSRAPCIILLGPCITTQNDASKKTKCLYNHTFLVGLFDCRKMKRSGLPSSSPSCRLPWRFWVSLARSRRPSGSCWGPFTTWEQQGPQRVPKMTAQNTFWAMSCLDLAWFKLSKCKNLEPML